MILVGAFELPEKGDSAQKRCHGKYSEQVESNGHAEQAD